MNRTGWARLKRTGQDLVSWICLFESGF